MEDSEVAAPTDRSRARRLRHYSTTIAGLPMKKKARGERIGAPTPRTSAWLGLLAATTLVSASAAAPAAAGDGVAPPRADEVVCVNPFSGASWRIRIDYDRATVDSNPARIDATEISWRDATDGWNYRLDRKSGDLTVTLASATGGNFLHDRCKLDP